MRIEYDGAVYHVTSRGNARKPIFRDDTDREMFLHLLRKVNSKFNWLCHALCLMGNHYHLVIETPDGNLSKGMRQLNGVYTQAFNRRHNTVGHILQGRYKAILIQKDSHLLEVCRYVVLNPVRARIVANPEDWAWSSYRGTAGLTVAHAAVTADWVLGQFSQRRKEAERRYRDFVRAGIGAQSIWKQARGQSMLGEDDFADKLLPYLKGQQDVREVPRNQRYAARPSLPQFITSDHLRNRKVRDRRIREAVERHAYSQQEVAEHVGLHYTSISRIMNRTER